MKRFLLLCLFMLATCVIAAPAPDEYPVSIHVYSSHLMYTFGGSSQLLDVIIDGKKYELSTPENSFLLGLGDYKARLVKDDHRAAYESFQIYELVMPDKKTRKYTVVGQAE